MGKIKHTEDQESKKDTNNNNASLIKILQEKFPDKLYEEIEAAIEIAGPEQNEIENYLANPVNGEGFTPAH